MDSALDAFIQKCHAVAAHGDDRAALACWDKVRSLFPACSHAWSEAAYAAIRLGRLDYAEAIARECLERLPGAPDGLAALAMLEMERKDFTRAAFHWRKLRQQFPDLSIAYLYGAKAATALHNLEESRQLLLVASQAGADPQAVLEAQFENALRGGNLPEIQRCYRSLCANSPNFQMVTSLTEQFLDKGVIDQALLDFLEKKADDSPFKDREGRACTILRAYTDCKSAKPGPEALDGWIKLVTDYPELEKAYLEAVPLAWKLKESNKAAVLCINAVRHIASFAKTVNLGKSVHDKFLRHALYFVYIYAFGKAFPHFWMLTRIFPNETAAPLYGLRLALHLKRKKQSEYFYDVLSRLAPDTPEYPELAAKYHLLHEDHENARKWFNEVIERYPASSFARLEAIRGMISLKDYPAALFLFEKYCAHEYRLPFVILFLQINAALGKPKKETYLAAIRMLNLNPRVAEADSPETITLLNLVASLSDSDPTFQHWHASLIEMLILANSQASITESRETELQEKTYFDHPKLTEFPGFPQSVLRRAFKTVESGLKHKLCVVCDQFNITLIKPVLDCLPPESFDISLVPGRSGINQDYLKLNFVDKYNINIGLETSAQYGYILCDGLMGWPEFNKSQYVITYNHSMDDAAIRNDASGIIFAYETIALYNTIRMLDAELENVIQITPYSRIEIAYTGPFSAPLSPIIGNREAILDRLENKLECKIDRKKPLVFVLDDEICSKKALIKCLNNLAGYCTVFFKPWNLKGSAGQLASAIHIIGADRTLYKKRSSQTL